MRLKHNFAFLLLLASSTTACFADDSAWQRNWDAGRAAMQRQNIAEAEKAYLASLKEAEKFSPDDPRLAKSLNNLAAIKELQGKNSEAEPLLKRSLAIAEKSFKANPQGLVSVLNNLAYLYTEEHKYAEALPVLMRASTIGKNNLDSNNPVALQTLKLLSVLAGKHKPAERFYKEVLSNATVSQKK